MIPIPPLSFTGGSALGGTSGNNSVNVNGAAGGSLADVARLLNTVRGPRANGGFSDDFGSGTGAGLRFSADAAPIPLPLVLAIGGVLIWLALRP